MTHSCRIIVLHYTKTGEKSLVLHCITEHWGRRSFITSISSSSAIALFAPMSILDCEITENPKSDLWRARSFSSPSPLGSIRSNMGKNCIALFMSEVLFRSIKDNATERDFFSWCEKSVILLENLTENWSNFHLWWLLDLSSVLGFHPTSESLAPFASDKREDISYLLQHPFSECMLLPLSGTRRNEIAQIIIKYISYHSECQIVLRSLPVLSEILR